MVDGKSGGSRIDSLKSQKKKKRKKVLLFTLIPIGVILLSALTYGGYIYVTAKNTVESSYEKIGRDNEQSLLRNETIDPIEDNVSVLIIGVDDSEKRDLKENSRSDTLMLATFNKDDEDVKLLTIPRDSYVYVPEVDYNTKITHAHAYGGPKATIDTVENFLNVPVDYYVRVNFEAFIDVIDSIGGIHYNVPFEMSEMDSQDKKDAIHLMPGYQQLNGEEALALSRTRKYDSDLDRGKRQQEIIKTIAKESASASSILKVDDIIKAVGNNMKTNLSFSDMKNFLAYGLKKNVDMEAINLDGDGSKMEDGIWYYQVDEDSRAEVEQELRDHLDLPSTDSQDSKLSSGDAEEEEEDSTYE